MRENRKGGSTMLPPRFFFRKVTLAYFLCGVVPWDPERFRQNSRNYISRHQPDHPHILWLLNGSQRYRLHALWWAEHWGRGSIAVTPAKAAEAPNPATRANTTEAHVSFFISNPPEVLKKQLMKMKYGCGLKNLFISRNFLWPAQDSKKNQIQTKSHI